MAKKKRAGQAELLKRDQMRVQRLEAQLQAKQYRAALSYYVAADTGRRNKDWRAYPVSADQAILPDALLTCARARTMVANSSLGNAAVRSQKRNVVGKGIMVVPVAKDLAGSELTDLNNKCAALWMRWASSKNCDVEQKRTYWQIQRMTVSEEFITGMSMVVWSYLPNQKTVGLRLQVFEYEQLNRMIVSYEVKTPDGQVVTNEVRGGVEVDENGAPVAYHFYAKNPNDFSYRANYKTIRVDAYRVLPYFDAERVHQSTGISRLAPVLAEMRSLQKMNGSTLDRNYMESCIGMAIKKPMATMAGSPLGLPAKPGDTGTTPSGMRKIDFVPGMVPELLPGEEITSLGMNAPGNTYQPFVEMNTRQVGAGVGMSYGALTRHNDGNYSAARQDMLEDDREIGPQQDMLIDHQVMPVYELFYMFAAFEGRLPLDLGEYRTDPDRFHDAEYIPPARPWIDPEKEANAYKVAIEQRIITRKQIMAMQGSRFANTIRQIASERDEAGEVDITFPEDQVVAAPPNPQGVAPADAGLALRSSPVVSLAQIDAPNYRPLNDPVMNCGSCDYFIEGRCSAYDFNPTPGSVCDSFKSAAKQNDRAKIMPQPSSGINDMDRAPDPAASTVPPP